MPPFLFVVESSCSQCAICDDLPRKMQTGVREVGAESTQHAAWKQGKSRRTMQMRFYRRAAEEAEIEGEF